MKTKKLRKHKKSLRMTSWVLKNNPVITMGLALPFAIVPTVSLKAGVAVSILVAAATVWMAVASSILKNRVKPYIKIPVLAITSMFCIVYLAKYMNLPQTVMDALGIYLPLASVNSLALDASVRVEHKNLPTALFLALKMSLGFALTACSVSAVREILAFKTIWGISFALYPIKITGLTLPCFGFIVLGFGAAFFRSLDRLFSKIIFKSENHNTVMTEVRADA